MSYIMGQIVLGLLVAWLFGFMLGTLWGAFMKILNAAFSSNESE
jgi:ABC-type uncharacterized transport system permease subunit